MSTIFSSLLPVLVALLLALSPQRSSAAEAWQEAIGRLYVGGKPGCGAALVREDLALTVAHCVARKDPWQPRPAQGLVFRAGGAEYRVRAISISPNSPFDDAGTVQDFREDWAVLHLAEPVGRVPEPIFYAGDEAARVAFLTQLEVVKAVRTAEGEVRTSESCEIVGRGSDGTLFLFRCGNGDGRGASGSALLTETLKGMTLIGMQSGRAKMKLKALRGQASAENAPAQDIGIAVVRAPELLEEALVE